MKQAEPALSEKEETRRGAMLAEVLGLKRQRDGRYKTTWGTKTDIGLFRSVSRIMSGDG